MTFFTCTFYPNKYCVREGVNPFWDKVFLWDRWSVKWSLFSHLTISNGQIEACNLLSSLESHFNAIQYSSNMSFVLFLPASSSVWLDPTTLPILFGSNSIITTSGFTVLIVLRTRLADSSEIWAVPIMIIWKVNRSGVSLHNYSTCCETVSKIFLRDEKCALI